MADIITRRAKQDRGFCLMQAQKIDHSIFDIGRRNGDNLIANVPVATVFTHRRNTQGVALIPFGQRHNLLGHCCRKHHRTAFLRGSVEDFFQLITETHVEHLIGFVEDRDLQCR